MNQKLLEKVDALLQKKNDNELRKLLAHQDFHVLAWLIDALPHGKRKTFAHMPPEKQSEVALVLNENSKQLVFTRLSEDIIARFLHFNDEDDATDILQYLPQHKRQNILFKMRDEKSKRIEKLLKFGSETAGGLMDLNFIIVKPSFTNAEVMEKVKKHVELAKQMPTVLVTSESGKPVGFVPERDLIFLKPSANIAEQAQPIAQVLHKTDREQAMQIMSRRRSEALAVVDDKEQVLGVIHLRDLLKVAQAEATEDIYRFAGVDVEETPMDTVATKVKRRYNWLIINLGTAFLASFVVAQFEGSISKLALLAVYMPIVAGQGGNAATQALAVVVRGLAVGDIGWSKARRVIIREALAGTVNGLITGSIAGCIAILFGANPALGAVLAAAMIINLFVAGFFGALIPFILKRFGIDPATAATVFVTTTTDVFGFLAFLGLGTLFLL